MDSPDLGFFLKLFWILHEKLLTSQQMKNENSEFAIWNVFCLSSFVFQWFGHKNCQWTGKKFAHTAYQPQHLSKNFLLKQTTIWTECMSFCQIGKSTCLSFNFSTHGCVASKTDVSKKWFVDQPELSFSCGCLCTKCATILARKLKLISVSKWTSSKTAEFPCFGPPVFLRVGKGPWQGKPSRLVPHFSLLNLGKGLIWGFLPQEKEWADRHYQDVESSKLPISDLWHG